MEAKTHYHLVILGGGPAGLSAGLYAARARVDHVLIEKGAPGGQVLQTDWIDNYPGFPDGASGFDLIEKMTQQAKRFDLNTLTVEVMSVNLDDPKKKVLTLDNGKEITCDSLIICTGAKANALGVPGEFEMRGKGVSYCGTCDAPFYRNMDVVVVGGGNTALQEAEYLTKFANKVTIIHRREELRATKVLQESALANEKIEFIWNSQVTSIEGENGVERINILNNDGETSVLEAQGIFIFVGITPLNECLPLEKLNADKWGFVPVDIETRTSVPGVMAAGDIISKNVRQVINAAGEGAVAVLAAEDYLNNL
ncbi:MAG: thioredoxin-disulfide reductase [Desulfotalea sp.]